MGEWWKNHHFIIYAYDLCPTHAENLKRDSKARVDFLSREGAGYIASFTFNAAYEILVACLSGFFLLLGRHGKQDGMMGRANSR